MQPEEFIAKWRDVTFGERQASQEMFLDTCALIDHATPVAYGNPDAFTFEKWVPGGFADAYLESRFVWNLEHHCQPHLYQGGLGQTPLSLQIAGRLENSAL